MENMLQRMQQEKRLEKVNSDLQQFIPEAI